MDRIAFTQTNRDSKQWHPPEGAAAARYVRLGRGEQWGQRHARAVRPSFAPRQSGEGESRGVAATDSAVPCLLCAALLGRGCVADTGVGVGFFAKADKGGCAAGATPPVTRTRRQRSDHSEAEPPASTRAPL